MNLEKNSNDNSFKNIDGTVYLPVGKIINEKDTKNYKIIYYFLESIS